MSQQKYPEPSVGGLIFDRDDRIFLMKSHKWRDKYTVPGGHIELGETMEEALIREVKEETGFDIYDIEFLCIQEFIYSDEFWKKRHFIFFDYMCKTDSTEAQLNYEAEDYTWITLEDAFNLPLDSYTQHAVRECIKRKSN